MNDPTAPDGRQVFVTLYDPEVRGYTIIRAIDPLLPASDGYHRLYLKREGRWGRHPEEVRSTTISTTIRRARELAETRTSEDYENMLARLKTIP